MDDLLRYAVALDGADTSAAGAPVDAWDPPYCGEMNLVIRRDGVWVHEGTPIGRARLVKALSRLIKREGGRYFLVTPVEKLAIAVEDAPFVAVLMRIGQGQLGPRLIFTTNVGEEVAAGPDHPIDMRGGVHGEAPYIRVRRNLDARIARAVYYDLAALGSAIDGPGGREFGVLSDGVFFPLGPAG